MSQSPLGGAPRVAATASSFPAAAAVFLSLLSLPLSFRLPQGGSAQSWILGHVPDHGPLWANTDGSFYHGSWSQMLLLRGRDHKVSLVTLARSTNPLVGLSNMEKSQCVNIYGLGIKY